MIININWSQEAIEDLESISEYISRDSAFYARAVITRLLSVSRNLSDFPFSGRIVPEIGDKQLRERLVYSYRLVYRVEEQQILIVAVIHGKQLMDEFSERF